MDKDSENYMETQDSLRFMALSGFSTDEPLCGLLQVCGCNILLDCGWSPPFDDKNFVNSLEKVASEVDLVLLSQPDISFIGALPYAMSHLGLSCPVYSTLPVLKMGQMLLYDHCISQKEKPEFAAFSLDDIDSAFSQIIPLKYNQETVLEKFGITLIAHCSGHMIGGTVWQIIKNDQSIIYAIDFNHHQENFRFGNLKRPVMMITSSDYASRPSTDIRERNSCFLNAVVETLRSKGNVLIPADTSARVLELIFLIESHWSKNKLKYAAVFLNPVAYSTLKFAASQLEWMNDKITDAFERDRDNPFHCRYVQACHSLDDFEKLDGWPKVVLTSMPDVEGGMARDLLAQWISNENNLILFTQPPKPGSLAEALLNLRTNGKTKEIRLKLSRRILMEGEELEEFEKSKTKRRKIEISSATKQIESESENLLKKIIEKPLRTSTRNISKLIRQPTGNIVQVLDDNMVAVAASIGEISKNETETLLDGFQLEEGAEYPIFPFEQKDEEEEWDDFGKIIDINNLFIKPSDEENDLILMPSMLTIPEEEIEATPSKIIEVELTLDPKATILYLNFSALSCDHFVRNLTSHLSPQMLVFLRGTKEKAESLSRGIKSACPQPGEVIIMDKFSESVEIELDKGVFDKKNLKIIKKFKIKHIQGNLKSNNSSERMCLVRIAGEKSRREAIFIGEVQLSAIRRILVERDICCNFVDKSLLCCGGIRIRVRNDRDIVLEGPLSIDYYRIQDILYGQYHIS